VALRLASLDALIDPDHRVRMVWKFVEGLDLSVLYASIRSVEGRAGHPPADPRILLALWLFATIEGIGSARALARLCEQHLAYQWLCGGVGMNHKSLSDFRVGHGALLEQLLVNAFAALLKSGIASLDTVAQDGMRVRASAGAASFRRASTLEDCQRQAEQRISQLRSDLDADPTATSRHQKAARDRAAADRLRRVEVALAAAEKMKVQQEKTAQRRAERAARQAAAEAATAEAAGKPAPEPPPQPKPDPEPRVSTTDPEARVMKMADGGYRPAYNVQFATDTKTGLIAGVAVDARGSDMGKLLAMSNQLKDHYDVRPTNHLVDGGFTKLKDIQALEAAGTSVYAPPPKPRDSTRDPAEPLPDDTPELAAWRKRMATDQAKEIYKKRAATAECINAQARNRGLVRLLVRGIEKVKAVMMLHALTHNMVRMWSMTRP